MMGELASRFEERCSTAPDSVLVQDEAGGWSAASVLAAAQQLAVTLKAMEVRHDDFAILAVRNSAAFLATFVGLRMSGVAVGLASPRLGRQERWLILEHLRPRFVLADLAAPWLEDLPDSALPTSRSLSVLGRDLAVARLMGDRSFADPETAVVKFSSGSTGRPKGVALSERAVLAEAEHVHRMLRLEGGDRIFAPVPLCHSYGFDLGLLPTLLFDAVLVVHESFVPRRAARQISDGGVAHFLGVPAMYRFLAGLPGSGSAMTARNLVSCTAPLPPALISDFHRDHGAVIRQHYGCSEVGAISFHDGEGVLDRLESVGRPILGVDLQVVDGGGNPLPAGGHGEIRVRSAASSQGYVLGGEAGQGSPFRDGWYWTGDQGYLDASGFLFVLGRTDDMINVGGLKVWPAEVQAALERHPSVIEAAVAGQQDAAGEQMVVAAVVLSSPRDAEEIRLWLAGQIESYKVPRRIHVLDELPRGPGGKVVFRPARVDS